MDLKAARWLIDKLSPLIKDMYMRLREEKDNYYTNKVNKFTQLNNEARKSIEECLDDFHSLQRQGKGNNINVLKIEVGNICFSIESNQRRLIRRIANGYKAFHSHAAHLYTLRCHLSAKHYLQFFQKVSSLLQIEPHEINIIDCSDEKLLMLLPDIISIFDIKEKKLNNLFRSINEVSFDSLLRMVYSLVAVEREGLLLHSAGLKSDGYGYVFFGPSQSGKSTIANLAKENYEILSDELTLIRRINGEFRVFGTPFIGTNQTEGLNSSSCLKALFLLQKDSRTYLKRMKKGDAIRQLLANSLFFFSQPSLAERVLDICLHLAENVPCYKMHFTLDNCFLGHINDLH